MMNDVKEIRDDEIRVLGIRAVDSVSSTGKRRGCMWGHVIALLLLVLVPLVVYLCLNGSGDETPDEEKLYGIEAVSYFEPDETVEERVNELRQRDLSLANATAIGKAYTEVMDTMINDIPLRIYIPHNAVMSLQRGDLDIEDTTIVYVAQAADIRADNGEIVGGFVINGAPLTRSVSKLGYCACVNGEIHVGMARNTDLFDKAVQTGGSFFRQYPLVHNGTLVDNEPKGKSIRRSICRRRGQVFMAETLSRESFHDFAQSLVDLGVDDAVYLVGSYSYGWAVDYEGQKYEFGNKSPYLNGFVFPENINYIVWR